MKVLYVQDTDWIDRNVMQHNHLAEMLVKDGHEVKVIDFQLLWRKDSDERIVRPPSSTRIARIYPEAQIEVIRGPLIALPFLDFLSIPLFQRRVINETIEDFKPDVVIGDGLLNPMLARLKCRKARIPFFYYCLDLDYMLLEPSILRPFGKVLESGNIGHADKAISINEGLRDYTIRMGAGRDSTSVVRAGVDRKRFNSQIDGSKIRASLGLGTSDLVLFFVGWLYLFSGLIEVIEELAKNQKEFERVKIVIAGDGDAYETLNKIIREKGLMDKVKLLGKVPYADVPSLTAMSDFCILPAHNNAIMRDIVPIKMYEYMAMGKPVIARRLRGLEMEFGNCSGVIFIEKPEDVLIKAIVASSDGEYVKRCEENKEFVKGLDWASLYDVFLRELDMR